jgi:hypothetical protein
MYSVLNVDRRAATQWFIRCEKFRVNVANLIDVACYVIKETLPGIIESGDKIKLRLLLCQSESRSQVRLCTRPPVLQQISA